MIRETVDIRDWSDFKKATLICEYDDYWDYYEEEDDKTREEQDAEIAEWDKQWKTYDTVVDYYDLEKSYESKTVILQRLSDGKLFKTDYTDSRYIGILREIESISTPLIEVTEKVVSTSTYI